jgi:hypothetical protein
MIGHFSRVVILALVCAASIVDGAAARTARAPRQSVHTYDGQWSVLIVTQRGSCDRAYRYGVRIVNGNVVYDGGVVNFSGRVAASGRVQVSVSASGASANGSGRLSRDTGRGSWSGRSGNSACSGYWEAERRG